VITIAFFVRRFSGTGTDLVLTVFNRRLRYTMTVDALQSGNRLLYLCNHDLHGRWRIALDNGTTTRE
jgi:hypothetical protein